MNLDSARWIPKKRSMPRLAKYCVKCLQDNTFAIVFIYAYILYFIYEDQLFRLNGNTFNPFLMVGNDIFFKMICAGLEFLVTAVVFLTAVFLTRHEEQGNQGRKSRQYERCQS